jgi:outer membrane protein assembly factor BamB
MTQVIRSEKRLQALDFWLRNPDYLADELVTAVEAGVLPPGYFQIAWALLDDPEPSLHAPIVVDGVMYVSGWDGWVWAIDARTGQHL